jgi:hypothetical protein
MFSIILKPSLKRASEILRRVFVGLHAKAFGDANKHRNNPTGNIVYVLHPHCNLPARVVTAKSACSKPIVGTEQTAQLSGMTALNISGSFLILEDKVNKWKKVGEVQDGRHPDLIQRHG